MTASGKGLNIENVSVVFAGELKMSEVLLFVKDDRRGSGDADWLERETVVKLNSACTVVVPLKTSSIRAAVSRLLGTILSSTGGCRGLQYASSASDAPDCREASLPGNSLTAAAATLAEPK